MHFQLTVFTFTPQIEEMDSREVTDLKGDRFCAVSLHEIDVYNGDVSRDTSKHLVALSEYLLVKLLMDTFFHW